MLIMNKVCEVGTTFDIKFCLFLFFKSKSPSSEYLPVSLNSSDYLKVASIEYFQNIEVPPCSMNNVHIVTYWTTMFILWL